MITVLCANPALDVTYRVPQVTRGAVHPVDAVFRRAGGKGTNVARVLHQLGEQVTLVAPLGGFAGDQYAAELASTGLDVVAVPVTAPPRTTVCVVDDDATVFNEPGPTLTAAEWDAVVSATLRTAADVLVLSGSLPSGVPDDAYAYLVTRTDALTVVDAKGAALAAVLRAGPDVVAPNRAEARDVVGGGDAVESARLLHNRGAGTAIVSAGVDGVVAITPAGGWLARPPAPLRGNPTGAGDALTAEVALGLVRSKSWQDILRAGVATSAATLACETAGGFDPSVRAAVLAGVLVREVRGAPDDHG